MQRTPKQHALAIYLQDHHAAARAGVELAARVARNVSPEIEHASELPRVAREIEQDLGTLETIMQSEGVERSALKDTLALAVERLGRLKLNGRFRGRARLSDVIELETLGVGILGKQSLWETLAINGTNANIDVAALIARAREQRAVVSECRADATRLTFMHAPGTTPSNVPLTHSQA